jgi:hypothetical protein
MNENVTQGVAWNDHIRRNNEIVYTTTNSGMFNYTLFITHHQILKFKINLFNSFWNEKSNFWYIGKQI